MKAFFDAIRPHFGGALTPQQVNVMEAIITYAAHNPGIRLRELAYMLATAKHEPGPSMTPNTENLSYSAGRLRQVWPKRFPTDAEAEAYAKNPEKLAEKVYGGRLGNIPGTGDAYKFRGRGLAHITGRENYAKAAAKLGIPLETFPDRALDLDVAVKILVDGLHEGWFTGKKLDDFIDEDDTETREEQLREMMEARRTINVQDQAKKIAESAEFFEKALTAAVEEEAKQSELPAPTPPITVPDTDEIDTDPITDQPIIIDDDNENIPIWVLVVVLAVAALAVWWVFDQFI